jgi:hypothetical protein
MLARYDADFASQNIVDQVSQWLQICMCMFVVVAVVAGVAVVVCGGGGVGVAVLGRHCSLFWNGAWYGVVVL